jgi:hypothetical protein
LRATSSGFGVGGYLMKKVIENHGGIFSMIENPAVVELHKSKGDSLSIVPGVYFQVKLPLTS